MLASFQVQGVAEIACQFEKVKMTFVLCHGYKNYFLNYSDCGF